MRKLLQTLLFDLVIAIIVVFFIYQFATLAKLDNYIVRKVVDHISKEVDVNTAGIVFSYKFPFTVKARHIIVGRRSMIGSVSVSINPFELLINDTIRITDVRLEDTLMYYEDLPSLTEMITAKSDNSSSAKTLQMNVDSILLKRVYFANEKGQFIRVDSGAIEVASAERYFFGECSMMSGEVYDGVHKIPFKAEDTSFRMEGDELECRVLFTMGDARLQVDAKKINGEYSGGIEIDNANLVLLNPDARGRSSINARLFGSGKIPDIRGEMRLYEVGYKTTNLVNGNYTFIYADEKLSLRDIVFYSGDTVFKGYLTSTLGEEAVIQGEFSVDHIRLKDLFHVPYYTDISAKLVFKGKGKTWSSFKGSLDITEIQGQMQQTIISSGKCALQKDGKLITLSAFDIRTDQGVLSGEGTVFDNYYTVALQMESIPLTLLIPSSDVKGVIDFRGVVKEDAQGLAATGVVTVNGLEWQSKKITKLFASIAHSRDTTDLSVYLTDVHVAPIPVITTGKIEGSLTQSTALLKRCELYFNDTNVFKASFSALYETEAWKSTDVRADLALAAKTVSLTSEFSEIKNNGWRVKSVKITDGVSTINAEASHDAILKTTELEVRGMLDIGRINSYKKIFPDVEGQVSLALDYKKQTDTVTSKVVCSMPVFVMVYENFSQTRFDAIRFEAEYREDHFAVTEFTFSVADTKNTFTGRVDCDINDGFTFRSFELHGNVKKMYASFLVNFATSDVTVTDGYFNGTLDVRYDKGLTVNADIRLIDTQLIVFDIGNAVVERLRGHATVENNRLIIHDIEGVANERGWVKMRGDIKDIINDRFLNFTITFGGLYIPNVWYFSGFGAGTIVIYGKGKDEILSGDIEIDSGVWSAPFAVFSRSARKELSGINMNIRMRGANNIWWRNDSVNIEFDVDFYVKKVYVEGKTVISGTMDAKKGTFYFLDVPFKVVKAQLMFANPDDISPDINLQGETDIFYRGKKRITLYVTGSLADPKISLLSDDPSLSQNDLLSLLAFNRPMNELENTGFMNEKAGEWATFYLQQRLLRPLKRSAMLDTLNVRGNLLSDDDRYLDVEVGKYLGNSFYLVYRNEMVRGQNQRFNVIYYINNNMSLETGAEEEKGEMKYNVDMKFKFKY